MAAISSIEGVWPQADKKAHNRTASLRRLVDELRRWRACWRRPAFVVLTPRAQAAGPWLVGRTIDRAIAPRRRALGRMMLVLLAVYLGGALAQRAQTRRVGATGQYLLADLRARLFAKLQALPLRWFDKRPDRRPHVALLSDVDTLNQLLLARA